MIQKFLDQATVFFFFGAFKFIGGGKQRVAFAFIIPASRATRIIWSAPAV